MKSALNVLCAVALTSVTAVGLAPSAAAADVKIGVAPSPNGLVMAGVPTQIAVSGTPKATVYVWNATSGKYFRAGTTTPKAAAPFTFQTSGLQKIKVVPSKGKAKVFRVPVYARFARPSGSPTPYGGLVLNSNGSSEEYSAPASAGCVMVDVGGRVDMSTPTPFTVTVFSSGANPFSFTVADKTGVGHASIPVAGDAVVQKNDDYWRYEVGAVWTCLTSP
jgi:hypothetical protein